MNPEFRPPSFTRKAGSSLREGLHSRSILLSLMEASSCTPMARGGGLNPAVSGSGEPLRSALGVGEGHGCLEGHINRPEVSLTAVEGLGGPLQHLQGERSDNVGLSGNGLSPLHSLRTQRRDHLGAVD
ncbi:hypothetical protein JZ751_008906 [Albula glossodonta]|uniref:Uncharacterized protein n=1 Tax=Albula glossodonta TaxID=121402 RepID=A0A8T2P818_9TELE|nr:hypothetical protein JZ751_008906 [Albula glossodonta]